tara:strand:- start:1123 stop:1770 length:648 start_codon:yes stop_codon:yes gene_type:complete
MSKQILVTGGSSKIGKEFIKLLPKNIVINNPKRSEWDLSKNKFNKKQLNLIKNSDKIVILHSKLSSKSHLKKSLKDITDQICINLTSIIRICEIALSTNPKARIIILGSESGLKGSYDIIYALTKSSIHKYVEERKIKYKDQQLLCLAPSTISDGKMTLKRKDKKNVKKSININPKKRGINSKEISIFIYKLLFEITDYVSNTTIHINGGKFSRM